MKRWDDKRSRGIGADGNQFPHAECRRREIKVTSQGGELRQLLPSALAELLIRPAVTIKELRRGDVVIPDYAATAQTADQFQARIPASRMMVDENVIGTF